MNGVARAAEVGSDPTRKPRRGDELEVRIESFDGRGCGIGAANGFRVRVRRGVPGETVRARVLRRRRDLVDAVVLERVEASPLAVPARCPHFGSCGGCSFQDLDYAAQLEGKRRLVEGALAARGLLAERSVEPVLPSPDTWAYRNKMEFTFGNRRWIDPSEPQGAASGFALGLHPADLHSKVIDVRTCPIQSRAADEILESARGIAVRMGISAWDVREHRGLLRHLVVRVARSTGEILVSLVTSEDADEAVAAFARELLERNPGITTFVHGVNTRPADTAIAERERVLHGPGSIREELGGLIFALSAGSFFQTNTRAAEALIGLVHEEAALEGGEIVWDLYCGTGTLALSLARSARAVVGFEISPVAVADARRNAAMNRIENALFVEGDVLAGVDRSGPGLEPPEVVLLDPPRAGLHPRLFSRLYALAPRRIVYVSCNPSAAAVDVERLVTAGWRLGRVRPVDLFPHTPHVECAIGLSRRG